MKRSTAALLILAAACSPSEPPHPTLGDRCRTVSRRDRIVELNVVVPGRVTALLYGASW